MLRKKAHDKKLEDSTLQELAGQEIEDEHAQELSAMQFIKNGQSEIVVVSLGKADALLASQICKR